MNNLSALQIQYQSQAILTSQINKSKKEASPLSIAKIVFDFNPKEGSKYQQILSFVYEFLDYSPFIPVGNGAYLFFIHNSKLHTSVMSLKNMLFSTRMNFGGMIKGIGISALEDNESIEALIDRIFTLCKLSENGESLEVHYGTSSLSYSDKNASDGLSSIFTKEPNITAYGFYKEAPMMQIGKVVEYSNSSFKIKFAKEYLNFLKKEHCVYLENSLIPDIMQSDIININMDLSIVELGEIKFLDNSPVHRKNIRVTPYRPIRAKFTYKDEFLADAIISDISKNSILLTTQLPKIEELIAKELKNKKFSLSFKLEDEESNQNITLTSMIFRITGNQIIINIYPDSKAEEKINEYILKCQKLLLLEAQGIRV